MDEPSARQMSHLAFLWPALAAASASEFAAAVAKQWVDFAAPDHQKPAGEPHWATPNCVALELNTVRLRDFSTAPEGLSTLLCAPFALHGATVTDFMPGHSLVAALRAARLHRLFVADWRTATPEMRYLAIDDYLAALNVLVDELGGSVDLVGLCQGGWLSLLYAARFPDKVRKLAIAGAPIDIAAAPSALSAIVNANPLAVFRELVRLGDGRVLGQRVLELWAPRAQASEDIHQLLQTRLPVESAEFAALTDAFQRWHARTVDLPGVYYLEVIEKLYRHNALAGGGFVALGQTVDLKRLTTPLYLLAARDDELVSPLQLFGLERLVGTPADRIVTAMAPCRHLGLFMGEDVLKEHWSGVAHWLGQPIGVPRPERRTTRRINPTEVPP